MKESIDLERTIERESEELAALDEERAALRPKPGAWSPKEELGHLIDSAANNHLRFVRAAIDGRFEGERYAQNEWVSLHGYQDMPWMQIVSIWLNYNTLLCRLLERIPEESGEALCTVVPNVPVTLRFLIDDYILHMQHHLDHLLAKEEITRYPRL